MTIHLDKVNGFGGGGGGGVTELTLQYPVIWKDTYSMQFSSSSNFKMFNVDRNKFFSLIAGYGGGVEIISINNNETSFSVVSTISGTSISSVSSSCLAEDDSFIICYYSGTFYYIPVNSDYTTGTVISLSSLTPTKENVRGPYILSSTRFALFDYANDTIYIFKLENGAITTEKTITTDGSVKNISCFKGNIVLIFGKGATTNVGIKIIDVDTETELYADTSNSGVDEVSGCREKDNFLFACCARNSTPYVTTPIKVYEYSNGQISKKTMTVNAYTAQASVAGSNINVAKDNNKYIITQQMSNSYNLQVLVCDTEEDTIDVTFITKGKYYVELFFAKINNKNKVFAYVSEGSYPAYIRVYLADFPFEKVATSLEYQNGTYGLTELATE